MQGHIEVLSNLQNSHRYIREMKSCEIGDKLKHMTFEAASVLSNLQGRHLALSVKWTSVVTKSCQIPVTEDRFCDNRKYNNCNGCDRNIWRGRAGLLYKGPNSQSGKHQTDIISFDVRCSGRL